MGEIDDFLSKMHGSMMNGLYAVFAIILFSDDVFEIKFRAYNFVPASCLAHARWASFRVDTVLVNVQSPW